MPHYSFSAGGDQKTKTVFLLFFPPSMCSSRFLLDTATSYVRIQVSPKCFPSPSFSPQAILAENKIKLQRLVSVTIHVLKYTSKHQTKIRVNIARGKTDPGHSLNNLKKFLTEINLKVALLVYVPSLANRWCNL